MTIDLDLIDTIDPLERLELVLGDMPPNTVAVGVSLDLLEALRLELRGLRFAARHFYQFVQDELDSEPYECGLHGYVCLPLDDPELTAAVVAASERAVDPIWVAAERERHEGHQDAAAGWTMKDIGL